MSQLIATALLPFVQQTALDAALALRDGRLDAAEAVLAALQAAGYQTAGDLTTALLGYVTQGAYDAVCVLAHVCLVLCFACLLHCIAHVACRLAAA